MKNLTLRLTLATLISSTLACSKGVQFAEKVIGPDGGGAGGGSLGGGETSVIKPPTISITSRPADQPSNVPSIINYEIIPGDRPIANIICTIDGETVACGEAGGQITLTNNNPGNHQAVIVVTDDQGKTDQETIEWTLYNQLREANKSVSVVGSSNQVDVLFVIDNSGSMREEQANMADRISNFMSRLNGLDWQVAIATTDPYDSTRGDGRILQFPDGSYFLSSINHTATSAQTLFGQTIQRPETGSGNEMGIRASYRAISRAVNPFEFGDYQLAQFFRSSAALSVIVISDEDESGTTLESEGTELQSLVRNSFGVSKLFQFHSIITRPGDTACYSSQSFAGYGLKYEALSNATGGVIGDICAADYGSQLTLIGQSVANTQMTYQLDCVPQDNNGNGTPDVSVTSLSGGSVPTYVINDSKITFSTPLSIGDYNIKYYCPN